jgi:ABC-type bacteriocin/lantibiotic exporter with double-glycine peptidase domain
MGAYLRDENFQDILNEIYKLFPILKEKRNQFAGQLSGGQRQRVALARAFYHDRNVLVMDESTSALDNVTESEIVREIKQLKGIKTVIVIAHRLTTLKYCDCIYRLDNGKIVEYGSYNSIMNKHNA